MPIQVDDEDGKGYLRIHCSGKVVKADYQRLIPRFEKAVKDHGPQKVLFDLAGFEGWDLGALWEELKFDVKHLADIQKCAVLGDKQWERAMTDLFKPFITAEVHYFQDVEAAAAIEWLLKA
jgi:hypothetical protein